MRRLDSASYFCDRKFFDDPLFGEATDALSSALTDELEKEAASLITGASHGGSAEISGAPALLRPTMLFLCGSGLFGFAAAETAKKLLSSHNDPAYSVVLLSASSASPFSHSDEEVDPHFEKCCRDAWEAGALRCSVEELSPLFSRLSASDLIVDALWNGDSPSPALSGALVSEWKNCPARTFAVGCPFGISPDTGSLVWDFAPPRAAVTFLPGAAFPGVYLFPGAEYAGELRELAVPAGLFGMKRGDSDRTGEIYAVDKIPPFPARAARSHKGSSGTVCVLAGSEGMAGAAYFAGMAAYRSGAGVVRLLTHRENREILQTLLPEAILYPYDKKNAASALERAASGASAVAVGPGLRQGADAAALLLSCLFLCKEKKIPCVIDADGINLLAAQYHKKETQAVFSEKPLPFVLTPHPGEMARLFAAVTGETASVSGILASPLGYSRQIADALGCVCLLKDAHTVTTAAGSTFINLTGSPALSTAGSGDCLTGVIAGLLAQGETPADAAVKGAFLHGRAGMLAGRLHGERSVMARDILNAIPEAIRENSESR